MQRRVQPADGDRRDGIASGREGFGVVAHATHEEETVQLAPGIVVSSATVFRGNNAAGDEFAKTCCCVRGVGPTPTRRVARARANGRSCVYGRRPQHDRRDRWC